MISSLTAAAAGCAPRASCDPGEGACWAPCAREADCAAGDTCAGEAVDESGDGVPDAIHPRCAPRRGGRAPGETCARDAECDRGGCLLGTCALLCRSDADCAAPADGRCAELLVDAAAGPAPVRGCLPRAGTLTVELGAGDRLALPAHAVGLNLWIAAAGEDPLHEAGITRLVAPDGADLYATPPDEIAWARLPIRYEPAEGSSMVLVSNNPARVRLAPGIYAFAPFAVDDQPLPVPFAVRARVKLADAPPARGQIPLHVFVTDLAGGCAPFRAADAPARLGEFERELSAAFAAAGLAVGPIRYRDSAARSSVRLPLSGPLLELDELLREATAGDDPDVLELVVVRRITGEDGFPILGIAGGIPSSTGIPGSIHSGAALGLDALCDDPSGALFGLTAAHELGHSMGLYHSVEPDGTADAMTDNDRDGPSNLMHWNETGGRRLSPEQAAVLLANPAVR